ncbi:MAG: molybdopterin molybdenumtransferase MoeA [Flavobacteriaceae bacterium]|nr:MAG: molybdopterin molybdenumtransferase MoeA [Flavobacteriaceae bacterium]
MVSVEEALQIILKSTQDFGVEEVPFLKSVGRVLKEDIVADRDFPPFNRVAMDGIAIDFDAFKEGQLSFVIEGIQAAGSPQQILNSAKNCYEVMTGAILPKNTNTVIRYEDVTIEHSIATVIIDNVEKGKNVHTKGKDRGKGKVLIPKNRRITAAEIGVMATVGKTTIQVARTPKIMMVSTGNELVAVKETPLAHQIRMSNVYTLAALLEKLHIKTEMAHIIDEKSSLSKQIASYLNDYDVLLFSGAVSKGKFDFLPEILETLGVKKQFHRVSQRPGKPFWFGHTALLNTGKGEKNKTGGTVVFAFPGNPVSTYVNCLVYFYPWFAKSVGLELKKEIAILGEDVFFNPGLTYFLQVRIDIKQGHLMAFPVKGNGSGDLASLVSADGFIELPKEQREFKKGETYPIIRYRNF